MKYEPLDRALATCYIAAMKTFYALALSLLISSQLQADTMDLYIGTFNEHIYRATLDMDTGKLSDASKDVATSRPGFLALHPTLPVLYSVLRLEGNDGVAAFDIAKDGSLTLLNQASSAGEGNCHVAVSPDGQTLVAANYGSGHFAALPLDLEGKLKEAATVIFKEGSSAHARQKGPHAHGATFTLDSKTVMLCDLGTDKVLLYTHESAGKLLPASPAALDIPPGSGPRHLALHSNGKWGYVLNELSSSLTTLLKTHAGWTVGESTTTLPDGYEGKNSTAEIEIHPNGRFVYCSNRGHDSTAVFSIHPESGKAELIQIEPTGGRHPRFIGLDPSGKYFFAANRDDQNIVTFNVDAETGRLTRSGHELKLDAKPGCIVFRKP